jgi:hypothetical protein
METEKPIASQLAWMHTKKLFFHLLDPNNTE